MKSAGKARNNGLYRHIRTSKEIIRNLLNDYLKNKSESSVQSRNRKYKSSYRIFVFFAICIVLC